jgi:phosphoenolpyruvate synthase/pyruvate phosphate dikinase
MNKKHAINLKNYTRLFSFDGPIPYLFSCEFVRAADWLNYLSIGDTRSWISYMHNDAVARANEEGLLLYGSTDKYKEFSEGLYSANASIRDFINEIQSSNILSREDVAKFFELVRKYRWHYTRTEFFFTDKAFEKKREIQAIEDNFKTFETLKLDGRKFLNEILLLPNSVLSQFLQKISDISDVPIEHLNLHSPEEIEYIFEGIIIPEEELGKRSVYIHHMYDDMFTDINGAAVREEIEAMQKTNPEAAVIKGRTAYSGKITAKARVIKIDIKDYDKAHTFVDEMQQGEVLVAESTEPSIILACNKASAIVTNQGGMMSHAAITAREMKIPCIVGTGVATTVIKTGDIIEVDADKGQVTIKTRA